MRDTFAQFIFEKAQVDPSIRLITADLGFGVFDKFASELPDQFINSGVTEQSSVSMAAGLSEFSKKVFVYSIANFITFRPLEQIRNDICYHNKNVCLVSVGAGYSYGPLGYSHHLIEDLAALTAMPNLKIFSPSNPREVQLSLEKIFSFEGPSYLRLGRSLKQGDLSDDTIIEKGGLRQLITGVDGTIIFTGPVKEISTEVWEKLKERGLIFSLYSYPYIGEINIDTLRELASSGPILTIEEHIVHGGIGNSLNNLFNKNNLNVDLHIFGLDKPDLNSIGSQEYMRNKNDLNGDYIFKWILNRLDKE